MDIFERRKKVIAAYLRGDKVNWAEEVMNGVFSPDGWTAPCSKCGETISARPFGDTKFAARILAGTQICRKCFLKGKWETENRQVLRWAQVHYPLVDIVPSADTLVLRCGCRNSASSPTELLCTRHINLSLREPSSAVKVLSAPYAVGDVVVVKEGDTIAFSAEGARSSEIKASDPTLGDWIWAYTQTRDAEELAEQTTELRAAPSGWSGALPCQARVRAPITALVH